MRLKTTSSHVLNSLNNNFESLSEYSRQHFWYECVSVQHEIYESDVWSITLEIKLYVNFSESYTKTWHGLWRPLFCLQYVQYLYNFDF